MQRLLPTLSAFLLLFAMAVPALATPRQRTEYVVTERNPFTGGVVSTTRFADRERANQTAARLSKAHWVQWKFFGVNEPLRFRRFSSSFAAQSFINSDGPSKSGKLGFAILTNDTRNVAAKVRTTTVTVPVTGGGNGGGNGQTDVGQVIETIIGIIDR